MNRRFGKNDLFFIGFLAIFCILICIWVYKGGAVEGSKITITVDGKEYGTYSLFQEQTITIGEGETKNIIGIKGGKAYMKEASCPDQLCVDQNEISFDKEAIICLPNKVVITVISDAKSDVDVIIR